MSVIERYVKPLILGKADELHLYAEQAPSYFTNKKLVKQLDQSPSSQELLDLFTEILGVDNLSTFHEKKKLKMAVVLSDTTFLLQLRSSKSGKFQSRITLSGGKSIEDEASMTFDSTAIIDDLDLDLGLSLEPSSSFLEEDPSLHRDQGLEDVEIPNDLFNEKEIVIFQNIRQRNRKKEIDELFRLMIDNKASDLHLTCGEPPVMRIDGSVRRLSEYPVLDPKTLALLIAPIIPKYNLKQFYAKRETDFAYTVENCGRFRANVFMNYQGMGAVFRLVPSKIVSADDINLPKAIRNLAYLSKGIVLVTGPTGSGKSTTLSALIDLVNQSRDEHIITIEDPIEFVHENKSCIINQREVGIHTNSFANALRSALREDPDVILVGELRDQETAAIAIETAETGHLVFGTLHTVSAVSTVDRLIQQFPGDQQNQIRMQLATNLKAIVAQTLLKQRKGGRLAAYEILLVTNAVSNLIREAKLFQIPTIMQTNKALGMQLFNEVLVDYVTRGIVDQKEAYLKAVDKLEFIRMLEDKGIDLNVDKEFST